MTNKRALTTFAVIYMLLSGCSHLPAIPSPDMPVTGAEPPVEPSIINLPVTFSLASIADEINKAVPGGEDHDRGDGDFIVISNIGGDVGYRYYWQRTPITLSMNGNAVNASAEVRYRVRGGLHSFAGWKTVCCGCEDEGPRVIRLGLKTTLNPGNDWHIEPHTAAGPVPPAGDCALNELKFLTGRISNIVQTLLNNTAADIDNYLRAGLNFRTEADSAWQAIQKPIPMPGGASLLLNPEAVQISPLNGQGDQLNFSIGLVARPRIVAGGLPPVKAQPLPDLSTAAPEHNFHVALVGEIPFDIATGQLAGNLENRTYVIENKKVYIEKVRLYGSGDSAIMEVKIKIPGSSPWRPSLNGTIYLSGIPAYDGAARAIYIRHLDFTPETKNALAKAANWLLGDRLRHSLAQEAKWYIGDRIDDQKMKLERALNQDLNPHVRLSGSVLALRPLSAGVTATSLRAVIVLDGTAALTAGK